MVVSVRSPAFLVVLLDRGVLVVHVQAGRHTRGDDPGAEPTRVGRGPRVKIAAEDQPDVVGAAEVEVVADDLLEEDPPGGRGRRASGSARTRPAGWRSR